MMNWLDDCLDELSDDFGRNLVLRTRSGNRDAAKAFAPDPSFFNRL
jgi:hypothetical protein